MIEMLSRDEPDALLLDFTVFMGQNIALGDDGSPRYIGIGLATWFRYTPCSFTDDFETAFNGQLKLSIGKVLRVTYACHEVLDRASSIKHVPKMGRISLTRQHR